MPTNATQFRPGLAVIGLALFAAGLLACAPAAAHSGVFTPAPGSNERKAILNALRLPVEKDLGMPVIFVVHHPEIFFRVEADWAFVGADFRHPDGSPMGESYYARSNDQNSDTVLALLHRSHGHWRVVNHDTGAVDAAWADWSRQYHAPSDLFPKSS